MVRKTAITAFAAGALAALPAAPAAASFLEITPPGNPRAGQEVALDVYTPGPHQRGMPCSADIDGDGYDDGTGPCHTLRVTFPAPGLHPLRVRFDDGAGTVLEATRKVAVHAGNWKPRVSLGGIGVGGVVRKGAYACPSAWITDDGVKRATVTWDLDGDGAFGDATGPELCDEDGGYEFPWTGKRTVSARVDDGEGGVTTASLPVEVYEGDRAPALQLAEGTVTAAGAGRLHYRFADDHGVSLADPEGAAWIAVDPEDDGTFEPATRVYDSDGHVPLALPAGTHRVGVRITDAGGHSTVEKADVTVEPTAGPTVAVMSGWSLYEPKEDDVIWVHEATQGRSIIASDATDGMWEMQYATDFGDGTWAEWGHFAWSQPGTYAVKTKVTNSQGKARTLTSSIEVRAPELVAEPAPVVTPQPEPVVTPPVAPVTPVPLIKNPLLPKGTVFARVGPASFVQPKAGKDKPKLTKKAVALGVVGVSQQAKVKVSAKGRVKGKLRSFGTAALDLAAGQVKPVRTVVPSATRKALGRTKTVTVTATFDVTTADGKKSSSRKSLKLPVAR